MWNKKLGTSTVTLRDCFLRSLLMALSLLGAVFFLSSFTYDTRLGLLEAVLLFGLLNTAVYLIITLGQFQIFFEKVVFFNLFANVLLIFLVSKIIPSFHVSSFSTAFWASILINIISWGGNQFRFFNPTVPKKKTPAMKQAQARVIASKKNRVDQP